MQYHCVSSTIKLLSNVTADSEHWLYLLMALISDPLSQALLTVCQALN